MLTVFIRKGKCGQRDPQEDRSEDREMFSQARKQYLGLLEAGRGKEGYFPKGCRWMMALPTTLTMVSQAPKLKQYISVTLSHSS